MPVTILVPRGAEEHAVRRGAPGATIVPILAGAASAALPPIAAEPDTLVVLVGICGSLGAAHVGDVVVYTQIVDAGDVGPLDLASLARVRALLPHAREVAAYTSETVITKASDRVALASRFAAGAVDMEAAHVARTLHARGIRFAMVRVVSDGPSADLPPIEHALAPDGTIRPLALASAFARAPLAAARFVRDVQASLRVLSATAAALAASK